MPGKRAERLPGDLPTAKVLKAFYRLGFVLHREGGEHTILHDPGNQARTVAIPRHTKVKAQLLRGILRGVGLSEAEFLKAY